MDYHKEVDSMKRMCRNVSEASERIRLEMEKIHRDEEAVRKQRTGCSIPSNSWSGRRRSSATKARPVLSLPYPTWCADTVLPGSRFGARRD